MKRTFILFLAAATLSLSLSACVTHEHVIGNGPKGTTEIAEKQWYILFGLVPLNKVDTKVLAAGATDYKIQTQSSFVDVLIGIVTSIVTIQPRTVTVTK